MSWTCPRCERSFQKENQWHYCYKNDLSTLFKGKNPELEFVFDKLLLAVSEWGHMDISPTKNCVVFVSSQTFLVVKPMKKVLNLKFYLEQPIEDPILFKVTKYGKRFEHHVRVSTLEEIDPHLISLIRESFELFN